MESVDDVKKHVSQKDERTKALRKLRGALGTFDEEMIQWDIREAEEI
ncbi:hypothetical protein [Thermococcus sp.]|nr:hypothetical protein [Thermococcus sp.]